MSGNNSDQTSNNNSVRTCNRAGCNNILGSADRTLCASCQQPRRQNRPARSGQSTGQVNTAFGSGYPTPNYGGVDAGAMMMQSSMQHQQMMQTMGMQMAQTNMMMNQSMMHSAQQQMMMGTSMMQTQQMQNQQLHNRRAISDRKGRDSSGSSGARGRSASPDRDDFRDRKGHLLKAGRRQVNPPCAECTRRGQGWRARNHYTHECTQLSAQARRTLRNNLNAPRATVGAPPSPAGLLTAGESEQPDPQQSASTQQAPAPSAPPVAENDLSRQLRDQLEQMALACPEDDDLTIARNLQTQMMDSQLDAIMKDNKLIPGIVIMYLDEYSRKLEEDA